MIDAVIEGMKMLDTRPENYRRIMIVMGESRDRGSKHKLPEAIDAFHKAIELLPDSADATTASARPPGAGG